MIYYELWCDLLAKNTINKNLFRLSAAIFIFSSQCVYSEESLCEDIPPSLAKIKRNDYSKDEISYNVSMPMIIDGYKLNKIFFTRKVRGDCNTCEKTLIFTELAYTPDVTGSTANVAYSFTPMKRSHVLLEVLYMGKDCGRTMYVNIE